MAEIFLAREIRRLLTDLAGVPEGHGEAVEHVHGIGVAGAQCALEHLGGRFFHLDDLRIGPPTVVENVGQLTLGDVGRGRIRVALPSCLQLDPPLALHLFPGSQAVLGLGDRRTQGRLEFRMIREPLSVFFRRAVEHLQKCHVVLGRVWRARPGSAGLAKSIRNFVMISGALRSAPRDEAKPAHKSNVDQPLRAKCS
jgi:hypothetical protein